MTPTILDGIYLERRGVLLPWGARMKTLIELGAPQSTPVGHGMYQLTWNSDSIFGGLKCSIGACLPETHPIREFRICPEPAEEPRLSYDLGKLKITEMLSTEGSESLDNMSLPRCIWNWRNLRVEIEIHDRFGEYCVLTIRRKGKLDEPNKTDAGTSPDGICRVIDASRSPSGDPGRSA